jgi:hypothetical protein
MTDYHANVVQMTKMLKNLDRWLDKAEAHAKAKSFDPTTLLQARLAPDMFPLVRQIQAACDGGKQLAARLAGKEPPKHPDTEQTFPEIRARVRTVLEYLATFSASDFASADSRVIPLGFMPGKGLAAGDFMREMNLPNTYFHLCMTYAILRHNGVDLGKMDFLSSLNLRDI